jgi:hypothetical protein
LVSAAVILIWLAAHNASSAHIEIAVVAAATRVMLTLILALFVVALIAIAAVLIMYFKTQPAPSSLSGGRPARRARYSSSISATDLELPSLMASVLQESSLGDTADGEIAQRTILAEASSLGENVEGMVGLLGVLFDGLDDADGTVQVCMEIVRIYFSGLSAHSAEIKRAQEDCSRSIARIASALERTSYDVHPQLRDMSRKNWFPTSSQWAAVLQDSDFALPYLALRIICLKAVWRAVAMTIYKPLACVMLLAQQGS